MKSCALTRQHSRGQDDVFMNKLGKDESHLLWDDLLLIENAHKSMKIEDKIKLLKYLSKGYSTQLKLVHQQLCGKRLKAFALVHIVACVA